MKTIISFRSKFFALVLALMASAISFAKDSYPDFEVDGLYYSFLEGDGVQVPFEGSFQEVFPTLWGLERTEAEFHTIGDADPYHISFNQYTPTLVDSTWYLYDGRNYFRETSDQVLLYAPYLGNDKDLVLYDWTLEVGDTLPFKPGRYTDEQLGMLFRVTDVSTITLLDGKEYKKWTLSGGYEYVEGIGAINKGFGHFYCLLHTIHDGMTSGPRLICASKHGQLLIDNSQKTGVECMCDTTPSYKDLWCDTWNVIFNEAGFFEEANLRTYSYKLGEDRIIGGETYTVLYRYWTGNSKNTSYLGLVRFSDDKKVYAYYDGKEYLVYDFSVEKGDTVEVLVSARYGDITEKYLVHDKTIDPVTNRTVITLFVFEADEFVVDDIEVAITWIEGVGGKNGFFDGKPWSYTGRIPYLLCAYKDGNQVYATDTEWLLEYGCNYNTGYEMEDLFPTLWGLQRTGCTKTIGENGDGITVWGSRSYLMQEIETTSIDGKQYLLFGINDIYSYDEYSSLWLREEDNKILVYSAAQKKDLVLYDFTLNIGDSLPRLYVDYELSSVVDYDKDEWGLAPLIVTEVSTITLLDGKEYRKWTFDNGMQYVEGLGSFGTCYGHNDFYQLIVNAPLLSDVYSQHLVCASKNGQLLYQMDDAEMERLGTECLCESGIGSSVGTITTPKTDATKILHDGQLFIIRGGKMYNILGASVHSPLENK